jgi:hypothetical protein
MAANASIYSFSGHESFPFRYPWLKKGFDAVAADGEAFLRDEAMTSLGVGKNMVRSIRHWCLAASVIAEKRQGTGDRRGSLQPTELGSLLLGDGGLDPFLEDPASLWLLHWQIASNRARATTWYWTFCHFHEPEFSREVLASALLKWVQTLGLKKVAASSVERDVDCFLRTYVAPRHRRPAVIEDSLDCPLVELNLIRLAADGQTYYFQRGSQDGLPDGVLLYATLRFWKRFADRSETLSLQDLARLPGSPGRLFKLDEASLAARYEQAERWTGGKLSYDETAGLRQLYRRDQVDPLEVLEQTYHVHAAAGGPRR